MKRMEKPVFPFLKSRLVVQVNDPDPINMVDAPACAHGSPMVVVVVVVVVVVGNGNVIAHSIVPP